MTALEYQIEKVMTDSADYYIARLREFAEDTWVRPTNSVEKDPRGNSYTIFSDLHDSNLVAKQVEPIWKNGSFCGQRVYFLYRHDLAYKQR